MNDLLLITKVRRCIYMPVFPGIVFFQVFFFFHFEKKKTTGDVSTYKYVLHLNISDILFHKPKDSQVIHCPPPPPPLDSEC
jgi:hypothetical protein